MSNKSNAQYQINLGHMVLTDREREVVMAALQGAGPQKIAEQLGVGIKTAQTHLTNICWNNSITEGEGVGGVIRCALAGFDWNAAIRKLSHDYELSESEARTLRRVVSGERFAYQGKEDTTAMTHMFNVRNKIGLENTPELMALLRLQYQHEYVAGQYVPVQFSKRETEVWQGNREGKSREEIARSLTPPTSPGTVRITLNNASRKSWRWRNNPEPDEGFER